MTLRYVDPAATGDNDGTEWTHAWADMQDALDTAVAGDIVYCRGTQTLTAILYADTNSGNTTNGFIKFIGCNASGNVDGTRFILDGNDAVVNCLSPGGTNSKNLIWFENIETKNATGAGFLRNGVLNQYWVFINCCSNNNGSHGFHAFEQAFFFRCVAYSNTGSGFFPGNHCRLFFSRARNNTLSGFDLTGIQNVILIGCISDFNIQYGYKDLYAMTVLFNCVANGNGIDGIQTYSIASAPNPIIGCRITNHSGAGDKGFDAGGKIGLEGWNYFQDNDGDNIQGGTLCYNIPYDGASSSLEDQADTESGYVDEDDPEDYNLAAGASLRRTAISIPTS